MCGYATTSRDSAMRSALQFAESRLMVEDAGVFAQRTCGCATTRDDVLSYVDYALQRSYLVVENREMLVLGIQRNSHKEKGDSGKV